MLILDWLDDLTDYERPQLSSLLKHKAPVPHTLPHADSNLNIYALPVGQGDLTVIQCPAAYGGKISIIDAGSIANTGFTKAKVIHYLKGQHIEKIILTHPHKDSINYIAAILEPLRASKVPPVYHSCNWKAFYEPIIKDPKITAKAHQIQKCCGTPCPDYYICHNKVKLDVIGSELAPCSTDKNGASVVTKIEYKGQNTLIPGDFEGSQGFVKSFIDCAGNLKSDIYRLAHQGSYGNANRHIILNEIDPKYAFSSSGPDSYHHPRCEIRDYLIKDLATTEKHPYVCYTASGSRDDSDTNKAIYSTTTVGERNDYNNDVLKFSLNGGHITVKRIHVG